LNDTRNFVVKLTNLSDGTGETFIKKVDVTQFQPQALPIPWTHMKLWSYAYDIKQMNVGLFWEGVPNQPLIILGGFANAVDMGFAGGIWNNATQPTGNVLLSTYNQVAGQSSYTIILHFKKGAGTPAG